LLISKLKTGEWIVLGGAILIIILAIVVGSIIYIKPPPVRFSYQETPDSMKGEALYRSQGCSACHELFGNGAAVFGPNLDGVGSRRSLGWLTEFLKNPRSGVSDRPYKLKMDPVELAEQELTRLAQYLAAQKELDQQGNIIEPHIK
jgi:cbb3-type cytochrome oxidase cytochrome c subunit